MFRRGVCIALCLGSVAACSNEQKSLTPAQFYNEYAQRLCTDISPACLAPVSDCEVASVAYWRTRAAEAAAANRIFVPSNAEECLAKVSATFDPVRQGTVVKKADFQGEDAACSQVFRGTSTANQVCAVDVDCLGTSICDKGRCGTAKPVAANAGCANIGEYCPQGSYCGDSGGVLFCTAKVGLGAACSDAIPCVETLRCAGGICGPTLGTGEDCASDGDCSTDFCEPFAHKCAIDVRFANGSAACLAMGIPGATVSLP
jgi:hypothetical protein